MTKRLDIASAQNTRIESGSKGAHQILPGTPGAAAPDDFEKGVRDAELSKPFDDGNAACKRCYREGYARAAHILIELPAIGESIVERDSGARGVVTRIMPNTIWFRLENGIEDFNIPEVFWETFRREVQVHGPAQRL